MLYYVYVNICWRNIVLKSCGATKFKHLTKWFSLIIGCPEGDADATLAMDSAIGAGPDTTKLDALVTILKRHTSDEVKFQAFLKTMLTAGHKGIPFDCLVRGLCDFPIEPEPLVVQGLTAFHQDMNKLAKGNGDHDPNMVDFNIVYAKFPGKVYTLIKVACLRFCQC